MYGYLYKFSSQSRSYGADPGDCIFTFNTKIDPGFYKLHHSLFFNSFYNVNNTNNKIYFQENSGSILIATLENGYYNTSNIVSNIHTQLEAIGTHNYTVTLSSTTNKLTIVPNTGTVKFWFATYTENSAKDILGFTGDTISASSLTSDIPIDLTDTLSLNVRIEGNGIENFLQDNNANFYSFTVPIISNSLELNYYEPTHPQYIKINNPIRDIRVRILNEDNEQIVMHNEYYFVLQKEN